MVSQIPRYLLHPELDLSGWLELGLTVPANETTVNQGSNGQFKTTVPKALAEANDLDGKTLKWTTKSGSAFEVRIVEDSD
jgi:hypothetical protein